MTAADVERVLRRHGFEPVGQSGSHAKWRHPVSHLQAIVTARAGKVLPIGTVVAIFTAANVPRSEWTD